MNRTELIDILKVVSPALSSKDFIPAFSHFCFSEGRVRAFDDLIALEADCPIEFEGALRGSVLIGFLQASKAAEVSITTLEGSKDGESVAEVKVGRARLKIPIIPVSDYIFNFPASKKSWKIEANDDVIGAIAAAAKTMGIDPAHPWRLGVTIDFGKKASVLYASDTHVATRVMNVKIGVPEDLANKAVVLHPKFCTQLIDLHSHDPIKTIELTEGWVKATSTGGVILFSKNSTEVRTDFYQSVFEAADGTAERLGEFPFPKGFSRVLERALVVLDPSADKKTRFTVEDGQLQVFAQSSYGDVNDRVTFEDHPNTEIYTAPNLIHGVLDGMDSITLGEDAVVLSGENITRAVRVYEKTTKKG